MKVSLFRFMFPSDAIENGSMGIGVPVLLSLEEVEFAFVVGC